MNDEDLRGVFLQSAEPDLGAAQVAIAYQSSASGKNSSASSS